MPPLQIRTMPDDVYEDLTQLAKDKHRSTVQQALVYIKRGIEQDKRKEIQLEATSEHEPLAYPPTYLNPDYFEAQRRAERKARVNAAIARIKAMPPLNLPDDFPSPEELIREDRDSR